MLKEEKLYEASRFWLSKQPEMENKSLVETDRVAGILVGITCRYNTGFIGALVSKDLRGACHMADDTDIELLPLYVKFMDYLEVSNGI